MTVLRDMTFNDIKRLLIMQRRCYGINLWEEEHTFKHFLSKYPSGCKVIACDNTDNELQAYSIAHPIRDLDDPPPLNFDALIPKESSLLFIHDVCVDIPYRNKGLARQLVNSMIEDAKKAGYKKILCIAVQDSYKFWMNKLGFMEVSSHHLKIPTLNIIGSYGRNALYLMKEI